MVLRRDMRESGATARRKVLRFRPRPVEPVAPGKVVFVLSGGGNRGAAQIGMLRALLEAGITPDVVVGTSVGSLNGAAIAADPTLDGVGRLEDVWHGITREQLFGDGRLLVDGGVLNNVPISHALAGPTDRVYVCDTSADLDTRLPQSALEVVLRSFTVSRMARARRDRDLYGADARVTFLPRVADHRGPFDFSGGDALVRAAYETSAEFLAIEVDQLGVVSPVV